MGERPPRAPGGDPRFRPVDAPQRAAGGEGLAAPGGAFPKLALTGFTRPSLTGIAWLTQSH